MFTEETLVRRKNGLREDSAVVEESDEMLADLKRQIEAEMADVLALEASVAEQARIKRLEEERHRHVQLQNTALLAKKQFIEANYDYTSTADNMSLEVFKNIVNSNTAVNETVQGFVGKVTDVKKEVSKILANRYEY